MSDIDTIRGALKQAEKIIGKQPGLTSSALAALDRLQAQQPKTLSDDEIDQIVIVNHERIENEDFDSYESFAEAVTFEHGRRFGIKEGLEIARENGYLSQSNAEPVASNGKMVEQCTAGEVVENIVRAWDRKCGKKDNKSQFIMVHADIGNWYELHRLANSHFAGHCFTSAHRAHRAHPPASTEPPSYVYSKDYEALYDLLMRGGEALGRQWNHPGTRIVIPTDIRPLHVPQWQHMMMLDKARFAKVCSEMNLEWIAPSTEPRLTVEQAWPYLQHKKGCNMLSFTNSMMSHAPMSQRLCDCGLDELRSRLTKAAKP